MINLLKSFGKRVDGQVSVIFALMSVPLLLAAGAAVDYVRVVNVRTELQASIDAAALAAAMAETKTTPQRVAIAKQYFNQAFSPETGGSEVDLKVQVNAKTVTAQARYSLDNSLMQLAGIRSSEISVSSEVSRAVQTTVEIAMVLDYSWSMTDNSKYSRMAQAARGMVDSIASKVASGRFKVGIVPFSAMVYTSMPSSYVTQSSWSSTWTGCTQDRNYPHNQDIVPPTWSNSTKWGYYDPDENSGSYSCSTYKDRDLKILPLTTDIAAVRTKLANMYPVGNTNIALGAEFGWNLLDPRQPYAEGNSFSDKETQKYLIILTDGVQTSKQSGKDGLRSVENGNKNLVEICKKADSAGIQVFAIAYDVTEPDITGLLEDCAKSNYYEPDGSGSEINNVFAQIADKIKNRVVRISR